jgi:NitT/TauT family transport system ATP-binding protein
MSNSELPTDRATSERAGASGAAVRVEHVSMDFGKGSGLVLDDVSLEIRAGQFISLIGPSGCGKTTLLRIISTLQRPTLGHVVLAGKEADQARRDRDFAVVFQSAALLEWRDALGNVMLPLQLQGIPRQAARQRAKEQLEKVGLSSYVRHYPRELSGGMQQRVSIARALTVDPELLLMDEPFGALDEITRERMNRELLELWGQRQSTVIFVTHNLREAVFLSDRIIVLQTHPGRIIGDYAIDLPRPRTPEMRDTPEFLEYRLNGERLLEIAIREAAS